MDKLALKVTSSTKSKGLRPSNVNSKMAPRTRVVYSKPVEICHQQVFNKHKVVERIARNTVIIISSFYRCKHPGAVELFDSYMSSVIASQKASLLEQQTELSKAISQAEAKGFKFDLQGSPAILDVVISNPHVQQVTDLLLCVDKNIDMLAKLLLIELIDNDVHKEHTQYALYTIDYIDKSLTLLLQRLNNEFSFKPNKGVSKSNTQNVDFDKIKAFLKSLHEAQSQRPESVE